MDFMEDEPDHDLAFRLQMEEAIAASLTPHLVSPPATNDRFGGQVAVSSAGNHSGPLVQRDVLDCVSSRREVRGTREEVAAASASASASASVRGFHIRTFLQRLMGRARELEPREGDGKAEGSVSCGGCEIRSRGGIVEPSGEGSSLSAGNHDESRDWDRVYGTNCGENNIYGKNKVYDDRIIDGGGHSFDRSSGWDSSARESNSSSRRGNVYGESSTFGESRSRIYENHSGDSNQVEYRVSSGEVTFKRDVVYRLYFKGLMGRERVGQSKHFLFGIGTAICDEEDNLLWEQKLQKSKKNHGKQEVEILSLLDSLQAAIDLGINRLTICCDYYPVYQFINRNWTPRQRRHAFLMQYVLRLTENLAFCRAILLPRNDVKFAFKLARQAIATFQHLSPGSEKTGKASLKETCVICLEDINPEQVFSVDKCAHRYCFSCMRQYVEVKLRHGVVPSCPHEGCKSELHVDACGKFLTTKFTEMWKQRNKEASIPVSQKVYCPYRRCSALMSKTEAFEYTRNLFGQMSSGVRKCVKCHGHFCINCKVPWHSGMSCSDYRRLNPDPPEEDEKLASLAKRNLWRRCVKCQHMIELSEGCFHMTCRCGYEFCYNCGAEWRNKAATCACPLWEEHLILHEVEEDFDDEFDAESDEDYIYGYDD